MEPDFQNQIKSLGRLLLVFALLLVILFAGVFYVNNNPKMLKSRSTYEKLPTNEEIAVEFDTETIAQSGFVNDKGVSLVIQNCTQCHSAKLVTQNRMSKEGWAATITWMQETQNLWALGEKEDLIIEYLAKNYSPDRKGRRQNLTKVDWYELE